MLTRRVGAGFCCGLSGQLAESAAWTRRVGAGMRKTLILGFAPYLKESMSLSQPPNPPESSRKTLNSCEASLLRRLGLGRGNWWKELEKLEASFKGLV